METRSRSKSIERDLSLNSKAHKKKTDYENDSVILPALGKKCLEILRSSPEAQYVAGPPHQIILPSSKAFCEIEENQDPSLTFVWDPLLPLPVRVEIANCCHHFQRRNARIRDHNVVVIRNHYTTLNLPMFFMGQFSWRENIDRLFNRLHDANNLPALTALPNGTYLGQIGVGYQNVNIFFGLAK